MPRRPVISNILFGKLVFGLLQIKKEKKKKEEMRNEKNQTNKRMRKGDKVEIICFVSYLTYTTVAFLLLLLLSLLLLFIIFSKCCNIGLLLKIYIFIYFFLSFWHDRQWMQWIQISFNVNATLAICKINKNSNNTVTDINLVII